MSDPAADQDLQIQIARLEHALGRVADDAADADQHVAAADADQHVAAAEQLAQSATDAGAAFDRLVREAGTR